MVETGPVAPIESASGLPRIAPCVPFSNGPVPPEPSSLSSRLRSSSASPGPRRRRTTSAFVTPCCGPNSNPCCRPSTLPTAVAPHHRRARRIWAAARMRPLRITLARRRHHVLVAEAHRGRRAQFRGGGRPACRPVAGLLDQADRPARTATARPGDALRGPYAARWRRRHAGRRHPCLPRNAAMAAPAGRFRPADLRGGARLALPPDPRRPRPEPADALVVDGFHGGLTTARESLGGSAEASSQHRADRRLLQLAGGGVRQRGDDPQLRRGSSSGPGGLRTAPPWRLRRNARPRW